MLEFLKSEKAKRVIYPEEQNIFKALETPLEKVKVVILGQDPYHGEGQAHGLAFSVPDGVKIPPSLRNIFKELYDDLGVDIPSSGNLERWAQQGVLLLNTVLTVQAYQAGSHQGKGWETFTDAIIKKISAKRTGVVFMLWGKQAQTKESLIAKSKHHILTAAHPSPLSAHNGFMGCKHFSQANELLGENKIGW